MSIEFENSDRRFRIIFENSLAVMLLIDPETHRIEAANNAAEKFYGWKRREIETMRIDDINTLSPAEIKAEMEKARKSERIYIRFKHRRAFGDVRDVEVYSEKVEIDGKDYLRSIIHDISEQTRVESELRQSEEKFRMVFESANVGKSITLPSGEIEVNKAFCDLLGYNKEELQNKKWQEITPPEEIPEIEKRLKPIWEGKTDSARFEKRYIHKNGSHIWADLSIRLMRGSKNEPLYFITTVTDISERKKAVEEQTKSLNLLNNLAAQVPGVVYQYRLYPDGRSAFPYSSPGMWDIYEVTPDEVQDDASPVFTRIHPDDYDYIVKTITESAKNQTNYESEFRVILPKQGLRWRRSNAKPELLEDGSTLWHGIITDITDRKKAEDELLASEERFKAMVEGAPDPIFIQTDYRFSYLNKPALRLLGANSESELLGKCVMDRFHSDFHETVKKRIKQLNEKQQVVAQLAELKFITLQGKEVWVETSGEPIFYQGKHGGLVFVRDITERKKAEEALSHSHELMKYIIDHNQSSVAVLDSNLTYLYVSQRYLRDYRVKEKNIIGKHHYEVFPDIPEKWKKVHQKALNGTTLRADEDIFYREDGTFDWTRWECRPWYEADGSIGGIILYLEVISEQKRKEVEIKKLNERLEILIDSIQQLSAAHSLDTVQDIVAKSARKLIGADWATLVFREGDYCTYVNEDATQPFWKGKKFPINTCISGWVMQNKKPVVVEDVTSDERVPQDIYSSTFIKSLAMVPVNISEPIGAIGNYWKEKYTPTETELQLLQTLADASGRAIENINLYAELEERVKQRTEQLQTANKELETFTYSVSHDLKAPLRGIDGYSKLLLDEYGENLNEEATHFIKTIRSSTLQMNRLIEDLLSYSRLERSLFKQEKIDLKSFVETLISNFSEEIKKEQFEVDIKVPEVEIVADSTGLSIALRNFIENAIKFTREKPNPKLEINFSEKPEAWIIAVKDNGVGFDMKYHDRIFEIFQRLHRPEDFPGTGIGLAMVAKALQRMEGKAWAESTPGEGSTFFIDIPKK